MTTHPQHRETTYTHRNGRTFQALYWTWDEVEAILGHRHDGDEADDRKLVALAIQQGALPSYATAEGWVDEGGWGLIGPEIEEDDE